MLLYPAFAVQDEMRPSPFTIPFLEGAIAYGAQRSWKPSEHESETICFSLGLVYKHF